MRHMPPLDVAQRSLDFSLAPLCSSDVVLQSVARVSSLLSFGHLAASNPRLDFAMDLGAGITRIPQQSDTDEDLAAAAATQLQEEEEEEACQNASQNDACLERPLSQLEENAVNELDAEVQLVSVAGDPAAACGERSASCARTSSAYGSHSPQLSLDDVQRHQHQLGRNLARLRLQVRNRCPSSPLLFSSLFSSTDAH